MRKELQDVKTFMVACGQPVRVTPQLIPDTEWKLRVHMLREEIDELEQAAKDGNLVEVADALTDIEYVLAGGFLQFGMGDIADPLFSEVQRSNMTKVMPDGKVLRNEVGKIQKPDGYTKPDLATIVNVAI